MPDNDGPQLELRDVTKLYDHVRAVDEFSLAVRRGEFVVLLGPSGSGKTTVLSIIGGFVEATSGQVLIGGHDMTRVSPARRPTATVFQDYALFPHLKVEGNVAFGLAMHRMSRRDRPERIRSALAMVGLADVGTRRIDQLSGGQRQRVALARALVIEPDVLLLDEPLGALDLNLRRQMQDELVRIQRQIGTTFVHVTHDQDEAMNIADVIVVMNGGRIEDIGPPERVYRRPRTRFVASFLGSSNLIGARVTRQVGRRGGSRVRHGAVRGPMDPRKPGSRCCYRSGRSKSDWGEPRDDMILMGEGRVRERTFQGAHVRARVVLDAKEPIDLELNLPPSTEIAVGDAVPLVIRKEDIVLIED